MGLKSIKSILAEAGLADTEQFVNWSKAWRTAVEGGSTESLFAFFSREAGLSEDAGPLALSACQQFHPSNPSGDRRRRSPNDGARTQDESDRPRGDRHDPGSRAKRGDEAAGT